MKSVSLLLGVVLLSACGDRELRPSEGSLNNGVYRNDYLRFSVVIPERWDIERAPAQGNQFLTNCLRLLAVGNQRATADTASEFSYILFRVSSEPLILAGDKDAVVTAAAVEIGQRNKPISRGSDFFYAFGVVLDAMKIPYTVLGTASAVRMGGSIFDVMRLKLRVGGQSVYHTFYVTPRSGHAIIFEVFAKNEKGLKTAKPLLESISFDNPLY